LDGSSGSESVTAPQLHLASPIGKVPFRLLSEIQIETLPEIEIDEWGLFESSRFFGLTVSLSGKIAAVRRWAKRSVPAIFDA
jgi:hypothetical protein